MTKWILSGLLVLPLFCSANPLDLLTTQNEKATPHKWFVSSYSSTAESSDAFDVWNIDSGYAYNVFGPLDVYVGASFSNDTHEQSRGFLSGVSYQFSDKITLNSGVRAQLRDKPAGSGDEKQLSAEVTSRVKLTESLNLHATLDVEEWQQGIEVGLGFSF